MDFKRTGIAKRIDLINVPVDILKDDEIEDAIKKMLEDGKTHQVLLLDLWGLLKARRNRAYRDMVLSSSLILPVSQGIINGAKFLKKDTPVKYQLFDFIIRFLGILEKTGKSVYLLGSKKNLIQVSASNLRSSFPGLKIVGRFSGFFKEKIAQDIITAIKKSSPSMVLFGSGLKGKAKWVYNNKKNFNPGILFWGGNCFEIFAGKDKRPAKALSNNNMEFVHTMFSKPWRIYRLFFYIYYLILLLVYKIFKK